jgi:hypothetical protein
MVSKMESPLKKEFDYYLAHQAEIVKEYNGKFVVIKDGKVIGAYPDELAAIEDTKKKHKVGTFLVQFVSPGDAAYKQTFHSRAVFQ